MSDNNCKQFTPADDPAPDEREGDAETLAIFLHTTCEHLAPQFGYETRKETREFDPRSPNGMLMIATAKAILDQFFSSRLAEAEAVIDAFWTAQADRMAQEYRERYPKGENL